MALVNQLGRVSPRAANLCVDAFARILIPLARGTGAHVQELNPTRAVLSMPVNRKTRNHLNTLYFGSQMMLVDLAAGALVFSRYPPGPFAGVIRNVEAEFVKKAKGLIRCTCTLSEQDDLALEQVHVNPDGKAEAWISFVLEDEKGDVVNRGRVLFAIKEFAAKEP